MSEITATAKGKGIRVTGEVYPDGTVFLEAPEFGGTTLILGAEAGTPAAAQIGQAFAGTGKDEPG